MPEVIALAGWPPEVLAFAFATYSRSALPIRQSIEKITGEKSSKFLETFYFQYGHKSIADNAHIPMAFENISEIAAYAVEDEQLWDGQERSTRFQKFEARGGYYIPPSIRGTVFECAYTRIADFCLQNYALFSDKCFERLTQKIEKPPDMKPDAYERTLRARAFDIARYWLFNGMLTSVGQITSARTLEAQISRLMSSEYPEIRELGHAMKEACIGEPFCPAGKQEPPLAPTLVKYAQPNNYLISLREKMRVRVNEFIKGHSSTSGYVWLAPSISLLDETVATLIYEASNYPYQEILGVVGAMSHKDKQDIIDLALADRGSHDPMPKAFSSGYQLQFDVVMDRGGERDLHRHRNCIQIHQPLTLSRGWSAPRMVVELGLAEVYNTNMNSISLEIRDLQKGIGIEADYLIPFAFNSGTLYKMHVAQAAYLTELRSGVTGHFSYREVACKMHEMLVERFPELAGKLRVTPFEQENLLKR